MNALKRSKVSFSWAHLACCHRKIRISLTREGVRAVRQTRQKSSPEDDFAIVARSWSNPTILRWGAAP